MPLPLEQAHSLIDAAQSSYSPCETNLSVIIPCRNEAFMIGRIIDEVRKLFPLEILVVANGCSDRTEAVARERGAAILSFDEALGTDVGRAIGAFAAAGDVQLFIDGDFVIPHSDLQHFVRAASTTCDLAVNKLDHHLQLRRIPGPVTKMKCELNRLLNREDLANASLTPVPFAIHRRVVDAVGWEYLLCPPLAYAMAIRQGWRVEPVHTVEVDRMNRYRPEKHRKIESGATLSPAADQIIGDHLEAVNWLAEDRAISK